MISPRLFNIYMDGCIGDESENERCVGAMVRLKVYNIPWWQVCMPMTQYCLQSTQMLQRVVDDLDLMGIKINLITQLGYRVMAERHYSRTGVMRVGWLSRTLC